MKQSSQFSVSLHILILLDYSEKMKTIFSSEFIAGSVNANAVVIRRLIGKLKRSGLVDSIKGSGGGFILCRSPEQIRLWDIFESVENTRIFSSAYTEPNIKCPVGRNIQGILDGVYSRVDLAVRETLEAVTLADVIKNFSE